MPSLIRGRFLIKSCKYGHIKLFLAVQKQSNRLQHEKTRAHCASCAKWVVSSLVATQPFYRMLSDWRREHLPTFCLHNTKRTKKKLKNINRERMTNNPRETLENQRGSRGLCIIWGDGMSLDPRLLLSAGPEVQVLSGTPKRLVVPAFWNFWPFFCVFWNLKTSPAQAQKT